MDKNNVVDDDGDEHNIENSKLHGMFLIGYKSADFQTDNSPRIPSPISQEPPSSTNSIEKLWKEFSSEDKDLLLTGLTFLHTNTFASYIEGTEIGLEEIEKSLKELVDKEHIQKYKILHFIYDLNERLMPALYFRKMESSLGNFDKTQETNTSLIKTFIQLIISLKKSTSVSLKKTLDGLAENMSSSIPSQMSIQFAMDNESVLSLAVTPPKKELVLDRDNVWPKHRIPFIPGVHPFEDVGLDEDGAELGIDSGSLEKVLSDLEKDIHTEDCDLEDAREKLKDQDEDEANIRFESILENMLIGEDT